MLFDSTILDDLSAGISHMGSLQAQRAIQTRWWHHIVRSSPRAERPEGQCRPSDHDLSTDPRAAGDGVS